MQPTLSPLFPHRSSLTPRSLYSMNPANPNPNWSPRLKRSRA